MTLYLKYRPQNVNELDLKSVRETLDKILASTEIPHAFLFVGPRGTGKTSSARILAKTINCEAKKNKPCGECEMCVAITLGSALDVLEIDAASNRGIDEIRSLRDQIKLTPIAAKYKVYIIDEVHMLTTEAFNALLKTLEEPPAHAIFVLCTTESDKLPDTVVSRCVRVQFSMPSIEEITTKLEQIVKAEEMKITSEGLVKVAQAAKGSFRDAIKILEQVKLVGSVDEVLQISDSASPAKFVELLESQDTQACLNYVTGFVEEGIAPKVFIERCVNYLRDALLQTHDPKHIHTIRDLETVYDRTKYSSVPQLPLEIFIIERLGSGKQTESIAARATSSVVVEKTKTVEVDTRKEIIQDKQPIEKSTTETIKVATSSVSVISRKTSTAKGKFSLLDVQTKWQDILKAVRPHNHSIEALLRSTKPIEFDGDMLELEVFYKFHKDKLETDKCRVLVEKSVGEVFQIDPIRLVLRLGERVSKKEEVSGDAAEDIIKAAEEIFKVEAM
jgi:DNA polymerase III subunit gamma/tau